MRRLKGDQVHTILHCAGCENSDHVRRHVHALRLPSEAELLDHCKRREFEGDHPPVNSIVGWRRTIDQLYGEADRESRVRPWQVWLEAQRGD